LDFGGLKRRIGGIESKILGSGNKWFYNRIGRRATRGEASAIGV
jgi:hypothetical protein